MTCKHCNAEIQFYTLEGRDLYCPICFISITGTHKKDILQAKQFRPCRNFVPDEEVIPELLEQERQRKLRYEQTNRQDRTEYFREYNQREEKDERQLELFG